MGYFMENCASVIFRLMVGSQSEERRLFQGGRRMARAAWGKLSRPHASRGTTRKAV